MNKWGRLMLEVPENSWEPRFSPFPMPWMRHPTKGNGAAPLAVPTEVLLGEDLDAALTHCLQQEEQMAETLQRGRTLNPSTQS